MVDQIMAEVFGGVSKRPLKSNQKRSKLPK
jgi:hypothetical protein